MTKSLPIQMRFEGDPVPDGISFTKSSRLHVIFQETMGDKVRRIRFAFPCELTSYEHCFAEEETHERTG